MADFKCEKAKVNIKKECKRIRIMNIRIDSSELGNLLPIFFGGLVAILIISLIVYFFVKRQDNNKQLVTRKVKVLEKPVQQGNIEWYVVQCENGERIKLRSFQANTVIIAVGDEGIIRYRGQTVESFQRK